MKTTTIGRCTDDSHAGQRTASVLGQDKGKTEATKLTSASQAALQKLSASVPLAKELTKTAEAILVFPEITKAGFMVGGQYGEGALLKKGAAVAYYKTTGASFGLQAGGQTVRLRDVLHEREGRRAARHASGFEVGVGPSIVVVDEGMGKSTTTKTLDKDIYAFIFSQKGLMAGLGLQGNKISKITPEVDRGALIHALRRPRRQPINPHSSTVTEGECSAPAPRRSHV